MIKFIDLFAGTGGIRLGFEEACKKHDIKTECVYSSEIDKNACKSYELNFGENPLSDITQVNDLPDFNFMLAGFPCQAFSYAGKRKGFGDTRGTLFFDVERLLKKYRPKGFVLENVRGLTTHDKGRTFETIVNSLKSLGYSIEYRLLNSSNFNVAQNRVRIYIVGILNKDFIINTISDVGAVDSHNFKARNVQRSLFDDFKPIKVVKDILEENPDPKYFCSETFTKQLKKVIGDDLTKLHGYRLIDTRNGNSIHSWELGIKGECTPDEVEFMNLLIANRRKKIFGTHQDGKALTVEQIQTFYKNENIKEIAGSLIEKGYLSNYEQKYNPVCGNMSFEVFKFLDPESISITLTASDTNRLGVVQNGKPRRLTPRECARLQGYPDSYKLQENDNAVYKQMGNGVSVPVIEKLISDLMDNNKELMLDIFHPDKPYTLPSHTSKTHDQNLSKSMVC
ncbi:DNA cytosine methyltransferase [Labilibaculum filiforme]|uniref:DNA cytosine methyltransferase n=1 Tax=Labilibaculum filiforme TaxID=1940526 RepID=UPI000C6C96C3|nr:DNA cytosine methyltransferase [Labilibaculum filiforme]